MERNRALVVGAARRVFLARGYVGASLEAIAEEAGFSKGVVYSQFGSKADLFLALLEQRINERARRNERIASASAGADGLREIIRAAARNAVTQKGWTRLLVEFRALAARDPDMNRRYAEAHARTVDHLASVLGRLLQGAGVPPRLSPRSMAEFVLAVDSGITLERLANPAALDEEHLTEMVPRALGLLDTR